MICTSSLQRIPRGSEGASLSTALRSKRGQSIALQRMSAVADRFSGPGGKRKVVRIKEQSEIYASHYSCGATDGSSGKSEISSKCEFFDSQGAVGYCTALLFLARAGGSLTVVEFRAILVCSSLCRGQTRVLALTSGAVKRQQMRASTAW